MSTFNCSFHTGPGKDNEQDYTDKQNRTSSDIIAERLSVRQLIVQCSHVASVKKNIYIHLSH